MQKEGQEDPEICDINLPILPKIKCTALVCSIPWSNVHSLKQRDSTVAKSLAQFLAVSVTLV